MKVTPTKCTKSAYTPDRDNAVDVEFNLEYCGLILQGECTLLDHGGSRGYDRWGDLEHWLDCRTIAILRDSHELDSAQVSEITGEIAVTCGVYADRMMA